MLSRTWLTIACVAIAITLGLGVAQAAPLGKAVAKTTAKKLSQRAAAYQKLGPIHKFEKQQTLIRWTNRPKTDAARGITGNKHDRLHVFTQYPHPGRKGSAMSAQRRLAIKHGVKIPEKIKLSPGTKYHVRPIRGGAQGEKEVIIHGPVPPRAVEIGGGLR